MSMRMVAVWTVVLFGATAYSQPATQPAKKAPCEPKANELEKNGRVEMTELRVEGIFKPGETITVKAAAAEVTGFGDYAYPGITVLVEPDHQFKLRPHTLYGVVGCGVLTHTWTFQLPASAKAGTRYRVTALACSGVTCRDPANSTASRKVVERVIAPR